MQQRFILIVCLAAAMQAHAAPVEPSPFEAAPVHIFPVIDTVDHVDATFGAAARRETLDAQRGGTDTVTNTMQLNGTVNDNVANNVVTGSNTIDAGSFANMSGIPTVIQNSGANVLIQNATIINLQFK